MSKKLPKIRILVDEDGNVVDVKHVQGGPLTNADYHPKETKRIDDVGVLATQNWCRWQQVGGVWKCV